MNKQKKPMIDKRYQVFISTSGQEMYPERMILSHNLMNMGAFSWGVEQYSPLGLTLARRQIDECDYFFILLGSRYGEQAICGHSYLQLEYEYARQINKPIFIIMHKNPAARDLSLQETKPELKQKFNEFRQTLEREYQGQIFYYQTMRDLEVALRFNFHKITETYPATGWVRPQNLQQLQAENAQLKSKLEKLGIELQKLQELPTHLIESIQTNKVSMLEEFSFNYRLYAYQDGNLVDVQLQRRMTWAQILTVFGTTFQNPTLEDFFAKRMNEFLNETGLAEVQRNMPRAHAVARAQIDATHLAQIRAQMQTNDWIVPVQKDERQRNLWQITPKAKKLLESNLPYLDQQALQSRLKVSFIS